MGFNLSLLIVTNPIDIDEVSLLDALSIKNLVKIGDMTFDELQSKPFSNKIGFATYNNCLIIYSWKLPELILENKKTEIEEKLGKMFPQSEICSLELISILNYWGYKIIKNKETIRHKVGTGENNKGTYIDIGEPLDEELTLLSKSYIDESNRRVYLLEDSNNMAFEESQVGEEFIFEIFYKYLNAELNAIDEPFYQVRFSCYKKKPFWKLW